MAVTLAGRVNVVSAVHPSNNEVLMVVMASGNWMVVRLVHPLNAAFPMVEMLAGMLMVWIMVCPLKALSAMAITGYCSLLKLILSAMSIWMSLSESVFSILIISARRGRFFPFSFSLGCSKYLMP